jgi:hypothetical protein
MLNDLEPDGPTTSRIGSGTAVAVGGTLVAVEGMGVPVGGGDGVSLGRGALGTGAHPPSTS